MGKLEGVQSENGACLGMVDRKIELWVWTYGNARHFSWFFRGRMPLAIIPRARSHLKGSRKVQETAKEPFDGRIIVYWPDKTPFVGVNIPGGSKRSIFRIEGSFSLL